MRKIALASACVVAAFASPRQAHAQKEAIGLFYEMRMAPAMCGWTNAGDPRKLDAAIASQEKALGVAAADKAALMKVAEADIRSDPGNCDAGGLLRPLYDEATR